jgi:hypothetical protein
MVLVVPALSCSGGSDELEEALASTTEFDLPIMVLPKSELGPLAADLEISSDWGFYENDEAAEDTFGTDDSASSLEASGRISGFSIEFTTGNPGASYRAGRGVVAVGAAVELFADAESADAYETTIHDAFEEFLRKEPYEDIELISAEEFAVAEVGDEAWGQRAAFRSSTVNAGYLVTVTYFRLGRLVGTAGIVQAGDEDHNEEATRLLAALEARVRATLLGEMETASLEDYLLEVFAISRSSEETTIALSELAL